MILPVLEVQPGAQVGAKQEPFAKSGQVIGSFWATFGEDLQKSVGPQTSQTEAQSGAKSSTGTLSVAKTAEERTSGVQDTTGLKAAVLKEAGPAIEKSLVPLAGANQASAGRNVSSETELATLAENPAGEINVTVGAGAADTGAAAASVKPVPGDSVTAHALANKAASKVVARANVSAAALPRGVALRASENVLVALENKVVASASALAEGKAGIPAGTAVSPGTTNSQVETSAKLVDSAAKNTAGRIASAKVAAADAAAASGSLSDARTEALAKLEDANSDACVCTSVVKLAAKQPAKAQGAATTVEGKQAVASGAAVESGVSAGLANPLIAASVAAVPATIGTTDSETLTSKSLAIAGLSASGDAVMGLRNASLAGTVRGTLEPSAGVDQASQSAWSSRVGLGSQSEPTGKAAETAFLTVPSATQNTLGVAQDTIGTSKGTPGESVRTASSPIGSSVGGATASLRSDSKSAFTQEADLSTTNANQARGEVAGTEVGSTEAGAQTSAKPESSARSAVSSTLRTLHSDAANVASPSELAAVQSLLPHTNALGPASGAHVASKTPLRSAEVTAGRTSAGSAGVAGTVRDTAAPSAHSIAKSYVEQQQGAFSKQPLQSVAVPGGSRANAISAINPAKEASAREAATASESAHTFAAGDAGTSTSAPGVGSAAHAPLGTNAAPVGPTNITSEALQVPSGAGNATAAVHPVISTGIAVTASGSLPVSGLREAPTGGTVFAASGGLTGVDRGSVEGDLARADLSRTTTGESHRTILATPTTLEVGVPDGTQGWLKIRAQVGDQGEVNAALTAPSSASQAILHRELPALNAYLHSEQLTAVATISERSLSGTSTGTGTGGGGAEEGLSGGSTAGGGMAQGNAGQDSGSSAGLNGGLSGGSESDAGRQDRAVIANAAVRSEPTRSYDRSAGLSESFVNSALHGESGKWLNVRA